MNIRFFIVFVFLVSAFQIFSSGIPHGSICAWTPGSYGNYPGIDHQRPPLPIWVQIGFDQIITDDFAMQYCSFLSKSNRLINIYGSPKKHGVTKNYVIVVDASVTQWQLKAELDKANRHFDPEIERQEKLKIEKAEQEARAIEEARKAKIAEEEQKKITEEAARKARNAEILRKQEEAEAIRLKKEAERLKIISELDPVKQALLKNAILLDSANNIKIALKAGANIDYGFDQPPLLWAILLKKFLAAHELLKNKANPNVIYSDHGLVHYLVALGNLDFACVLVKYGADREKYVNTLKNHLETKLYNAIINDSAGGIRQAVELGADINHGNQYNAPLVEAVLSRKSNAVAELLRQQVNIDISYSGYNLVHHAMQVCDMKSATLLIKAGASFSENDTKVFGDNTLMEKIFILQSQASVTQNQCFEFLQELINHGYNLNSNDSRANALYQTLWNSGVYTAEVIQNFLEFFIKNGVNINQLITIENGSTCTPLFQAIMGSDVQKSLVAIKVLLAAGADINKKASMVCPYIPDLDQNKLQAPLFFAIKWWQSIGANNNEVINLLIEHGANL